MEVLWGYVVLLLSLLTAAAADTEHSLTSDMILSALCVITHGSSRVGTALRQIGTPTERLREVEQFAECHTASRWWHWNSNPEGEGLKNTFCKSSLPEALEEQYEAVQSTGPAEKGEASSHVNAREPTETSSPVSAWKNTSSFDHIQPPRGNSIVRTFSLLLRPLFQKR